MSIGVIKTIELLHLNEAAKALKQKDFQIVNYNFIIGLDNIDTCIKYTILDSNIFYNQALEGMIVNTRELSAFVKNITIESEFKITQFASGYNTMWNINSNSGAQLFFRRGSSNIINFNEEKILRGKSLLVDEIYINDDIQQVFSLRKNDGCFYYKFQNKYFITLFSGILPLNKADKVYLSIYSNNSTSFIAKFRIKKKKFDVYIYITYLYI